MRKISVIEPKIQDIPRRKKVAAYARVSEEKGRTMHSLSAQVSYYSQLIQKNPEWEYVGVYSDGGITGTSDNRTEFKRLLGDCEAHKINIVLVKSISRFARNTVDLLETVRHLRDIGIEVRFEKERINSLSEDSELMLTLLGSFAQEESRSISENVKWAIRKGFEKGQGNQFCIYGYRWDGKEYHIVPEEAEIIRLIYANFLAGLSAEQTEKQLETMGVKSYTGGHFGNGSIRQILRQERYTGNTLFQKTYIENHITHKSKLNHGELPQFYAENTHPAIITQATFDAVQTEVARRRALGAHANPAINTTCLSGVMKCGACGRSYVKSTRKHGKEKLPYTVWECTSKKGRAVKSCKVKDVPDIVLKRVCADVLGTEDFDADVFTEQIENIIVSGETELTFIFRDGTQVVRTWESTAKKDWWTPERKKEWGERHKNRATNPNRNVYYAFTGFIKCGECGSNYRCQTHKRKDGTQTRSWYCSAPTGVCGKVAIKDETMKALVTELLDLADFDEAAMDKQIEYASILKEVVTFHFRDGHTVDREFHEKRYGTKWTEERRERQVQSLKDSFTAERRAAMSERMKQIRSEKKWSSR